MESFDIDPAVSKQMFGCSIEKFEKIVLESGTYQRNGALSYAMSILSDCQEMLGIEGDDGESKENIRQALNRAKFLLAEMQDGNMIPVVQR